ncbi:MAG: class I SAM-dependent methyltransferase [Cyclobacteriaceae bacterium]|nr:class I SAM-dependent methyltransferase [Cyclobacteriaceae bacterium HetDA_MAG_MS6]
MNKSHKRSKSHSQDHLGEARQYWWNTDYLKLLADRLDLASCQQVADIGCGVGTMSFALSSYLPNGASLTGVDMEHSYVKTAKQKARHLKTDQELSFNFLAGHAESIPLEDDTMDLTFCQTLLIHVEDPKKVISEMKRITKPGGYVVSLEPNNLVSNLMFDNYSETDFSVPDVLQMLEIRLLIEKGKKKLGEGYSSLGDVLPELFINSGLEDIQVWLSDKAHQLIPPYDNREKRVRAAQMIDWIETDGGGTDYESNLRYFKAGGGKQIQFDQYWSRADTYKRQMLDDLKKQKYISAGGSVMYIVAGVVPS